LILSVLAFFKTRLSYAVFMFCAYIIPTLSGSFSSFPRYALVLFPGFIVLAIYLSRVPSIFRILVYTLLGITLVIAETLFVRGYWVS